MTACPILGKTLADLRLKMRAPTATRTRDLLLRRHFRIVAEWCRVWPDMPFRRSGNRWTWPGVALCLWSLAPR